MEAAATLPHKRQRDIESDDNKCIICQNEEQNVSKETTKGRKKGKRKRASGKAKPKIYYASADGIKRIAQDVNTRRKYNDSKYADFLERFDNLEIRPGISFWHGHCYKDFTNNDHLQRLKIRHSEGPPDMENVSNRSSRQHIACFNSDKCIFCQPKTTENEAEATRKRGRKKKGKKTGSKHTETLTHIETMPTSDKILHLSKLDPVMRYRMAGVNDLIADDGKYHLTCYTNFLRRYENNDAYDSGQKLDYEAVSFNNTMDELKKGLSESNIYHLSAVWDRYCDFMKDFGEDPGMYRSNRFKERIQKRLEGQVEFVQPLDPHHSLMLFPPISKDVAMNALLENVSDEDTGLASLCTEEIPDKDAELYSWLYRVAVKVRGDLVATPGHSFIGGIDTEHAEAIVPDSLYVLLRLLCSDFLEEDTAPEKIHEKVLSIAQDIIYTASSGKKLTPKHLGIGLSVHQMTRSKEVIQLLHAAGHSISYDKVLRVDTSLGNSALASYEEDGVFIPRAFKEVPLNGYVKYGNDNVDKNIDTLDGKGSFHGSQTVAFCRSVPNHKPPGIHVEMKQARKLTIPPDFQQMKHVDIGNVKPKVAFAENVNLEWYTFDEELKKTAESKDLAWVLSRLHNPNNQKVPSWTGFNHTVSNKNYSKTIVGTLPLIDAPAHDYDTIWTVMMNCMTMTEKLGQKYTVVTFDQQLYCKAKMLQWYKPEELKNVVVMLGGFHTQMNYGKCIGQFLEDGGMKDVWVESEVYGDVTADRILAGKDWNKMINAHKLVLESLWQILWPKFMEWMNQNGILIDADIDQLCADISESFEHKNKKDAQAAYEKLFPKIEAMMADIAKFDEANSEDPTFMYWRQYMGMVGVLLRFTRAIREGDWMLYLSTFAEMIPHFAAFSHTNYTRWGAVFLADMKLLEHTAPEVYQGFINGDFVVKETDNKYNQVPDDQAVEHVNRKAKDSGGLVGIIQAEDARTKWCLTCNDKAELVEDTKIMLGAQHTGDNDDEDEEDDPHKDLLVSRIMKSQVIFSKFCHEFQKFQIFAPTENLVSLVTGDVATEDITDSLLHVYDRGKKIVENFVTLRLVNGTVDFYSTLPKSNTKTFSALYDVSVTNGKERQTIKADRDLFRRIIIAIEGGREIDIDTMLEKELSPVPLSLAKTDGSLHQSDKANLAGLLHDGNISKSIPESQLTACTIIDAMALVHAMGKPQKAHTFGDYAANFITNVKKYFTPTCTRVDVVFDSYQLTSIKDGTRKHRTGKKRPIRSVIKSSDVKLPHDMKSFLQSTKNKQDLANFLSVELSKIHVEQGQELVIGGGFAARDQVFSSLRGDVPTLAANHEEADTRMILHAQEASLQGYQKTVVICRDTDVLVLLLNFRTELSPELWMQAGTYRDPRYIAIHDITIPPDLLDSLLAFHAVSGSDSTSKFAGIGKKSAWKVFKEHPELLSSLGIASDLSENVQKDAEDFVCKLYDINSTTSSINKVRANTFRNHKSKLDNLPPTQNALIQHLKRSNYQAYIWRQSLHTTQDIPSPGGNGWILKDQYLIPVLITQDAVPSNYVDLASCGCKSTGFRCRTRHCMCKKNRLRCTRGCSCKDFCCNPLNLDQ